MIFCFTYAKRRLVPSIIIGFLISFLIYQAISPATDFRGPGGNILLANIVMWGGLTVVLILSFYMAYTSIRRDQKVVDYSDSPQEKPKCVEIEV